METTFKYKDKIITTPNLEKKLKRMKLSLEDIEIIPNIVVKKEEIEETDDKEIRIIRSTLDDIRRCVYVPINTEPVIKDIFDKHIWNGSTGIKGLTPELISTFYYEKRNS